MTTDSEIPKETRKIRLYASSVSYTPATHQWIIKKDDYKFITDLGIDLTKKHIKSNDLLFFDVEDELARKNLDYIESDEVCLPWQESYPLYTDILKVLKTGGLKFKVVEDTVTSKVRLRIGSGHFIIEVE